MSYLISITMVDGKRRFDVVSKVKRRYEKLEAFSRARDFNNTRGVKDAKVSVGSSFLSANDKYPDRIVWKTAPIKGMERTKSCYESSWQGYPYQLELSDLGTLSNGLGAAVTMDGRIISFAFEDWKLRAEVWYFDPDPGEMDRIGYHGPLISRGLERIYAAGFPI